jgi:hypothetical protein
MALLRSLAVAVTLVSAADYKLPAFQPFAAFGNTIHVATADFDGVGVKDYNSPVAYNHCDPCT